MIDERFKPIKADADLMHMITGSYEADAYTFRAFDKWEDAVEESFSPDWMSELWYPTDCPVIGKMYLLLLDNGALYVVDIAYAECQFMRGIEDTLTEMLKAIG